MRSKEDNIEKTKLEARMSGAQFIKGKELS
jgi:hypothetical protein